MNWYKKALRGEWWIIDGSAIFADANVGELGHEAHVVDSIQRKYAYDEFDKGEWIDWDAFKRQLASEVYEEQFGMKPNSKVNPKEIETLAYKRLQELGMTHEEYSIAENRGDARAYGMRELGWKRVAGNNIQTQTLTSNDLKDIASGLYDIDNDLDENSNEQFTIEVAANGVVLRHVPYKLISDASPSALIQYRDVYAQNQKTLKLAKPTIEQIAEQVRSREVRSYDDEYLKDNCLPVAKALTKELTRNGYNSVLVQGNFKVDKSVSVDPRDKMTKEDNTMRFHYWTEILISPNERKNLIVDLTAIQFEDEVNSQIKPIEVGTYEQLNRYIPIIKGWDEL